MPNDTLVNARSPVTKKSNGTVIAGPDVCKTPVGPSVVPIPYVNISKSSDLAKGSKNVSINGAPVCLKDSEFSTSTGDEPGTLKGLISSTTKGKSFPIMQSFDVKFEGQGVVRNVDPYLANNKNTPPTPLMQAQTTPAVIPPLEEEICEYCKKPTHRFAKTPGRNVGSSTRLSRHIIPDVKIHQWYTGKGALQAHHLICSEAMSDDDWPKWCSEFGYDIDRKQNGVMLPGKMELACQLHAPLHISNHSAGKAGGMNYPKRVSKELEKISEEIRTGKYCDTPQSLTDKLDQTSKMILSKIDKFAWTLTADGSDYNVGGIGCGGGTSIPTKPKSPCPHSRLHNLKRGGNGSVIPQKLSPLAVGT